MSPKVITLSNASLLSLINSKAAKHSMPALKQVAKRINGKVGGCRCGGRRARARDAAINDFKRMLRGWPPSEKAKLKKFLGAGTIRVFVDNKMIEL